MSDTDDTDHLLLIPPDFFVVESDSTHSSNTGPYYNIVTNLIKQVDNLKDRIKSIESNESLLNNSLDYLMEKPHKMQNSVKEFRKYNSSDDIYLPSSTQSTPQKPLSKFKINSLPASPNIDRFSMGRAMRLEERTPKKTLPEKGVGEASVKEDDRMLGEIDMFLSKVKTIQRLKSARNLEDDFNRHDIARGNKRSKDTSQVPHVENSSFNSKEPNFLTGTTEKSPNFSGNRRDLIQKDIGDRCRNNSKYSNETEYINHNPSRMTNDSVSSFDKYPVSDSSTDSTQVTSYRRKSISKSDLLSSPLHYNALSILSRHKQLRNDSTLKTNMKTKENQKLKSTSEDSLRHDLGLLSLADIWCNNSKIQLNESHLSQKLQEEKLRRQHCEDLIHDLQNRNLELQEKLSVAIKVDQSKNKAIHQFQAALEKILVKLERVDKEKQEYENEITVLKNKHLSEMEEATKKLLCNEKEVSEALSLAHQNEGKMNMMEKRCYDLQSEIYSIEIKFKELQGNYEQEIERNKKLSEILNSKEIEIIENKNTLNDARCEIARSKGAVEVCQSEFNAMKEEYSQLNSKLKYEKEQTVVLNDQKNALFTELEGYKSRESELKDELSRLKKEMENNKSELRHYYQGQVEILVQNKLKEFQSHLDRAQSRFEEDIRKREMSIAKTAASHIQKISEKCSLEIKLLEKKHQEEIKLHQIQVMQHKQQVDNLQGKLDQFQEKRLQIAKQLQKIMESQWSEALRIIASGKSPTLNDESTFSTIDQLNSLKMRSYNNVEELLAQQQEEQFNIARRRQKEDDSCRAIAGNDRILKDVFESTDETPVSSRTKGNKFGDNDIQKYIHLLLNRQPGNPTQEEIVEEAEDVKRDNEQTACSQQKEVMTSSKGHQKDGKFPKRPWK